MIGDRTQSISVVAETMATDTAPAPFKNQAMPGHPLAGPHLLRAI